MTFQPLDGLRVLDLTSVMAGPAATWRLGRYGAEIIKVESPAGDLMRGLGGLSPSGTQAGAYLHLNRGKRNIRLDLKAPGAAPIIARLVETADVIVANLRPKALEKLGLDPATIRARHPEKIYCLLTGFGSDGPYAGLPAYDSVVQGAAGIPGLMLERDGAPVYLPLLICDHVTGEIMAGAILAAVLERRATGRGRLLEVPMFETMAAFVLQEHLAAASFDPPAGPIGDQRLLSPHNRPVRTADGFVALTVNTDAQVRAFLAATDRAHLARDPRFATVGARAEHVAAWFEVRGAPLTGRGTEEWLEIFRAADIPAMPCHSLSSLVEDPHLKAVGLIAQEDHPTEGRAAVIRASLRVDGAPIAPGAPSAACGADTAAILAEAGYDADAIAALIAPGGACAS